MLRISKKPAALTAAAILTAALAIPAMTATAAPATAAECVQAGLVWVHVEFDDTSAGACAEKFDTAQAALLDTGLTTQTDVYVTEIADRTSVDPEWWSVYSKRPVDGTYPADWDFAQVALNQLELEPSSVLAVVLQDNWANDALPPVTDPVEGVDLEAEPTPTPSATATPTPTSSETPRPVVSPVPEPVATPTQSPTTAPRPGVPNSGV